MNNKDFTLYPEAFELKQLGFDEPCLGYYFYNGSFKEWTLNIDNKSDEYTITIQAPTYSQAFRFFREKHGLCIVIKPIDDKKLDLGYNLTKNGLIMDARLTYEGAELACLRKLIEIVKNKR